MKRLARLGCLLALVSSCSPLLTEDYTYGKVEVQVVRRSGEPVPGASLTLYNPARHSGYGTTDADGRFVFDLVPEGDYGVSLVLPDAYATLRLTPDTLLDSITLRPGRDTAVSFTVLKKGAGSVAVRVLGTPGVTVPKVEVELYDWHGSIATTLAEPNREHVFGPVPFGSYGVRIVPPAGFVVAEEITPVEWVDGVLVDEGSRQDVSFTLARCAGAIRVRTVDAGGKGIEGVPLRVYDFRGTVAEGQTGPQGEHEFTALNCADYGVSIRPAAGFRFEEGRGTSYVDGIVLGRGGAKDVTFTLARCTGRIEARVVDGAGAPVAGAKVTVYTSQSIVASETTDATGVRTFEPVPCTSVGVSVEPPAGYTVQSGRGTSYFDGIDVSDERSNPVLFTLQSL